MRHLIYLAIFAAVPFADAGVYKWVDAQGKVHFSDTPPAGQPTQPVRVNPTNGTGSPGAAKQPTLAEQEAGFNKRRMEKAEAEAKAKQEQDKRAERQRYCGDLKGHLAGLKSANSRLVKYDENGKRQMLDSSEKQAEIKQTEQAIAQNCSG